jgi:hypothetical protein
MNTEYSIHAALWEFRDAFMSRYTYILNEFMNLNYFWFLLVGL